MIYFGGCSITMGTGFHNTQQDPSIYPNIVAQDINHMIINDAEGGSSNLKIFTKAAKAIIDDLADIYVVQWSAPHRHWLYPMPNQGIYIGSVFEENQYKNFVEQFQKYNHDYPNLMSVIDYCRIITELARLHSRGIVFVNGMLYWKPSWNDRYMEALLKDLDLTSQQDFQQRFDNNVELLDLSLWANPWISIAEMQQDNAPLDQHPGPLTHKKIADLVISVIDTTQRPL
jgi:hypothetical protein